MREKSGCYQLDNFREHQPNFPFKVAFGLANRLAMDRVCIL